MCTYLACLLYLAWRPCNSTLLGFQVAFGSRMSHTTMSAPQTGIFAVHAEDVYNLLLLATKLAASRLRMLFAACNMQHTYSLLGLCAYIHIYLYKCMHDSYPTAILSHHHPHQHHAAHNVFVVNAFC